jgi:hypothetical protein
LHLDELSGLTYRGITEQSRAAKRCRADADALLEKNRHRAAMYLGGYAIECSLKTALIRRFSCDSLDELGETLARRGTIKNQEDVVTHNLESMLRWSDRIDAIRDDVRTYSAFTFANQWRTSWRYAPEVSDRREAVEFLQAIDVVVRWIEANV